MRPFTPCVLPLPDLILIPLESPCAEASKASMDCLNRHDYDRDKCLDFFQAYRDCKKAWVRSNIPSLSPTAHVTYANRSPRWNNARQIAARGGYKWRYAYEGHEYPKSTTVLLSIHMYEAHHSSFSGASAPPVCLFGAQDPGVNPCGPRTVSTTCIVARTFSSSHG